MGRAIPTPGYLPSDENGQCGHAWTGSGVRVTLVYGAQGTGMANMHQRGGGGVLAMAESGLAAHPVGYAAERVSGFADGQAVYGPQGLGCQDEAKVTVGTVLTWPGIVVVAQTWFLHIRHQKAGEQAQHPLFRA